MALLRADPVILSRQSLVARLTCDLVAAVSDPGAGLPSADLVAQHPIVDEGVQERLFRAEQEASGS